MAAHSAGAMDVRNVIGSLLAIYGVILTAMASKFAGVTCVWLAMAWRLRKAAA